ncbi:hypothetical protein AVEN_198841-1 [Araneus ventricosus]|uniref:Uncharacterized protein n=1 Tax=Araneus ventricosus TaxID=182803 RepID=A0A4Y2JD00_ARAVE|nr:hypothetical protein AVEN_198841-1 [Araneus ventricosus]
MFILPALLYLKELSLFGQCPYHFIVPNKSRPPHAGGEALSRWLSPGLTPLLGRPGQCGHSCTTPAGGRLTPAYDLTFNTPNTRRIFSGIGFEPGRSPVPKPRPYH